MSHSIYAEQVQKSTTVAQQNTNSEETVCANRVYHDTVNFAQTVSIDDIREGHLPHTLNEAESLITAITHQARIAVPVSAILIADARRQFATISEWVAWAKGVTGMKGDDLHHRRQIGDLLLDALRISPAIYRQLFDLDQQKLISIYRIKRPELSAFLRRYDPAKLSRDDLRVAVSGWLGENSSIGKPEQLTIIGLGKILDKIAVDTPEMDTIIANIIQDRPQAEKATTAAQRLSMASVAYYLAERDITSLNAIRISLITLSEDIRKAINAASSSQLTK